MSVTAVNQASIFSGTNLSSYATGSRTPTANQFSIAAVTNDSASGTPTTPTLSGNGITWTQLDTYVWDTSGGQARTTVFVAKNGASPSAGAVTADFGGVSQAGCNVIVDEFDGVDVSGTSAQCIVQFKRGGADSSDTSDTIVMDAGITSGNASYGTFSHQAEESHTAGDGHTNLADSSHAGPACATCSMFKSAGSQTVSATWTTSSRHGGFALEIKAAATAITGTLSKTQAADTSSSSSKLQIKGTLSKSQIGDALSSVSDLIIKGATAKAQTGDTLSAAGKIMLNGSVNASQAGDALSAAADLIGKGTLNTSQDNQSLDADGILSLKGSLSISQQDNTLDADGVLPLVGDLSKTQEDQTLSSSADISINGSLNVTQQGQTLAGVGTGDIPTLSGSLNATQADNELIAFGDAHLKASVSVTQQDNAQEAVGRLSLQGAVNVTQQGDTVVSSGSVTIAGILDVSQQGNTVIASAITPRQGSIDVTQDDQLATISSKIALKALLNVSQAGNTLSSVIQYRPPVQGPGGLDVIAADDMDKIYAEDNGIIYADDINDI